MRLNMREWNKGGGREIARREGWRRRGLRVSRGVGEAKGGGIRNEERKRNRKRKREGERS